MQNFLNKLIVNSSDISYFYHYLFFYQIFSSRLLSQAVECGHNGGSGPSVARPVEEDLKDACAPVAYHYKAARVVIPSLAYVEPLVAQVNC